MAVRLNNMDSEKQYFYPDVFDVITLSLAHSKDPDLTFWKKSEDSILSYAEEMFKRNRFNKLLDVGCGDGRLTVKFSKYFNRVIALEPDKIRMEFAKYNVHNNNISNVTFVQSPFLKAGIQDDYFDVVICNHVIQHINTDMIEPTIQGIFNVLRKDGIIVLTTSYSKRKDDYFLKSFLDKEGNVNGTDISEKSFNNLIINEQRILPIHFFTVDNLKEYLSKFSLIKLDVFDDIYPHSMLDTVIFIGSKPS